MKKIFSPAAHGLSVQTSATRVLPRIIFLLLFITSSSASCVLPSEYAKLVAKVNIMETKVADVEKETGIAIANSTCGKEIVDLMKDVAALCTKELLCSNSEILSAISDADPAARFLFLMKTQRGTPFYFPEPWSNPIQISRLSSLIAKRQLTRTKILIVSNSTPRKANAPKGADGAAVEMASDRAFKVVEQLKQASEKMHIANPRVLPITEQDIRVWIVPYLVQDADLGYLGSNEQPPIGYINIAQAKQKQAQLAQLKQAVFQSVWVYLIDCWPTDLPASAAGDSPEISAKILPSIVQ